MTASWVFVASMEGRTVATGGGPAWEFLIPAALAIVAVLLVKAYGGIAGFMREMREARERDARLQAAVDDAFDRHGARQAMGRAADAAASESGSAAVGGAGIGLPGLLFVTFLVLKLTGVIDWSWWWVTAPLWISAAVFVVIFVWVALWAVVLSAVRR